MAGRLRLNTANEVGQCNTAARSRVSNLRTSVVTSSEDEMSAPRKKMFGVFLLCVLLGSAGPLWHTTAQNSPAPKQSPVQRLPDRLQPPPVTAGDRGVTYHSLENKATQVITTYADAIATAERGPDGDLSTR